MYELQATKHPLLHLPVLLQTSWYVFF